MSLKNIYKQKVRNTLTNRKTIGKLSKTRATWNINPVTRVKKGKTKYTRKKKHKNVDSDY